MNENTPKQTSGNPPNLKSWAAPMERLSKILTEPHSSIQDKGDRRQAQVLSTISLILSASLLWGILSLPRAGSTFAAMITIALLVYILSRTRRHVFGAYLFSFGLASLTFIPLYLNTASGFSTSVTSTGHIALIIASVLLPIEGLTVLAIFSGLAIVFAPAYSQLPVNLDTDFFREVGVFISISAILLGGLVFRRRIEQDRLDDLEESNRELEILTSNLEARVTERTKALETSAEISRRLTSILDPRELAREVVNQIQSSYNYYYAQIYLYDEAGENLVLTAGTGEAGKAMLKRGHSLPKGRGLVGRAATNKESILVSDTSQAPDWLPNELLPDTKAEAVVPIFIGDQVLGVLDVQDDLTNDITEGDITLLESLASQVAISLQNAESYARADAALKEARSLVENASEGIAVLDLTTGFFTEANENAEKLYELSHDELMKMGPGQLSPPTQPDGRDSGEKAMEMIGIAMEKGANVFEWVHINGKGEEFPAEIRLTRMPGDYPRIRVTLIDITERQGLQKLTAQRARQQETINSITQKIQSTTSIEEAMQVAVRELGHALGQKQTAVTLAQLTLDDNSKADS